MAAHNLNIQSYSLPELLSLFDIQAAHQISQEDIKRAKKKVLMLHPDKSRLTPEYFLFYKKAFDAVVQIYNSQNRQNQVIDENTIKYRPQNNEDHNKSTAQQINKNISQMSSGDFNNKFNNLFESNQMSNKPDPRRNEWFTSENAAINIPEKSSISSKNMGQAFDQIKQNNSSSGLIRYRGVQDMYSGNSGSGLYDDLGDNEQDAESATYITSDPFSKLKYDDLRKVHKDETVFAVSESDFDKMPKYQSVDHFNRERGKQSLDPLSKDQAQQMLSEQERLTKERMVKKEFDANLRSQQFVEKNKTVLASFMYLK